MDTNHNDTKKLIGALLLGTAVGAVIGLLFAPAKGSDTRKAIVEKGEDITDNMKEKFNEFLETIKKEYEGMKEAATNQFSENSNATKDEVKVK